MSAISNFALSGVWDYHDVIVPAAVAAPLVVEGVILAKNIVQKPHVIKEKILDLKETTIESFTIQPEQSKQDGIRRILKNIFYLLSCLALMATAAYFSITLLPSSLAITTAISAIFLIGKLFANAGEYKRQLIDAFTAREGEDPIEAKKRIRKNIFKTVAYAVGAAAAIGIGAYILAPMITHGFSWSVSLPLQTKGVVFAEYASVGTLHGALAYKKWEKGDKLGALFHLFTGALCFAFPSFYWNNDMRLHHSFYGLLLMATPYRPLQIFGGMVTLDSSLYMLQPWRGYTTVDPWGWVQKHEYDFINSVVDNYPLFAGTYAGAMMIESINDNWTENEKTVEKNDLDPQNLPLQQT